MYHLVFLTKKPMQRILDGTKTVESRLSKVLHHPCRYANVGDTLYFKEVAGDVLAMATVKCIDQYIMLWPERIRSDLAQRYAEPMGIAFDDPYWAQKCECAYGWFFWLEDIQSCHIPAMLLPRGTGAGWIGKWSMPKRALKRVR